MSQRLTKVFFTSYNLLGTVEKATNRRSIDGSIHKFKTIQRSIKQDAWNLCKGLNQKYNYPQKYLELPTYLA